MCKQSKQRRKIASAKQISATRKGGGHGPKSTTKTNKKVKTWWRKKPGEDRVVKGSN
jgi:hypothetical protein